MSYDIDPIRGVVRHYNTRAIDESRGGAEQSDGRSKTVEYVFDYDNLPTNAQDGQLTRLIPAGCVVESAVLDVIEDFTTSGGTATMDIGLTEPDGTAIDADGLVAAAAEADLVAGAHIVGAGALVGANIGSADGQVDVTPSDTLTAGKGRILLKYTPEPAVSA